MRPQILGNKTLWDHGNRKPLIPLETKTHRAVNVGFGQAENLAGLGGDAPRDGALEHLSHLSQRIDTRV